MDSTTSKLKDRLVAILALEEESQAEKFSKLQSFYSDISIESATIKLNIENLQSNIVPLFHSKITNLQQEIQSLEAKQSKNETVVNNLKKLATELESQMEVFFTKSKTTQLTMHQQREVLTVDFSKGVEAISTRLKDLEIKKGCINDEYKQLQSEFSECIHDFEIQEKDVNDVHSELETSNQETNQSTDSSIEVPSVPLEINSEQDDYEVYTDLNFEEESVMMYEDYRSHLYILDQQDIKLQNDLAIAVSKFQELSTGLLTSKNCLMEHHRRVAELEKTLVSLEGQKTKGKKILKEINRVIDQEKGNYELSKVAVESIKAKLSRCGNMKSAFDADIETLQNEISLELQAKSQHATIE